MSTATHPDSPPASATARNVIVIYADDLGWGDLGCYGSTDIATPHLDALAASGVRMTQWYSNSPVCSPSRASLMTGRHPAHAGIETILSAERSVVGLPDQATIASQLGAAGRRSGIFGKWHLGVEHGSAPLERGFSEYKGFRAGCVDYYSHIMYWGLRYPIHDLWDGNQEIWRNGEYLTEVITDWACEFIGRDEGPFFCYVPYNAPHYPMHAPEEYMRRFAHLPWEKQVMAAMISCMDDGIGRIVQTLKDTGHYEDTIILFSSDNGPSAEERNWLNGEEIAYPGGSTGGLRGHKGSVYEGGIRVPAIWSWPAGLPADVECAGPAQMIDVLPTLLEAVGAPPAEQIDGESILPLLRGEGTAPERALCWEYTGQLAVRRGDWKLVTDAREKLGAPVQPGSQLFNLADDPREQHPLPPSSSAGKTLATDLEQWQRSLTAWRTADSPVPPVSAG